jgi:hypothetical protein
MGSLYRLEGLEFEVFYRRIFLIPYRQAPRPIQFNVQFLTWLFPGVKWPDCKVDHSPPSNAEAK